MKPNLRKYLSERILTARILLVPFSETRGLFHSCPCSADSHPHIYSMKSALCLKIQHNLLKCTLFLFALCKVEWLRNVKDLGDLPFIIFQHVFLLAILEQVVWKLTKTNQSVNLTKSVEGFTKLEGFSWHQHIIHKYNLAYLCLTFFFPNSCLKNSYICCSWEREFLKNNLHETENTYFVHIVTYYKILFLLQNEDSASLEEWAFQPALLVALCGALWPHRLVCV